MVKEKKPKSPPKKNISLLSILLFFITGSVVGLLILAGLGYYFFENSYQNKVYPGIMIDYMDFGGKSQHDIETFYSEKSKPLRSMKLTLFYGDQLATISAGDLSLSYDGKLSGAQALSIGRSGKFLTDLYQKWKAYSGEINLSSSLKMNTGLIDDTLDALANGIDVNPDNALFQFENGKVTLFHMSKSGLKVDKEQTKNTVLTRFRTLVKSGSGQPDDFNVPLAVKELKPDITTESSNNFGIKELIGVGNSKFAGSIPGRVHNVILAANRISGHLVAPGEIFSFNKALGDVSANTGFQPAYIIKNGRTVLGDGGGVCQVSTTLFRAALNAGLPVTERHAHAYRVGYYEQDEGPGLDATVYDPGYDLKIKNDTDNYILIQAKSDSGNYLLSFEIYGVSDGRKSEITKPIIFSQTSPPPDLYQDDPTLPAGTVKQVDWKAWGAKVSFTYKVVRNNEVLQQATYFSNYQPWQSVFLRGTKT